MATDYARDGTRIGRKAVPPLPAGCETGRGRRRAACTIASKPDSPGTAPASIAPRTEALITSAIDVTSNASSPPPEHAYFRRARFMLSVDQLRDLPRDEGHEIAFVGRSNVGKSSVINALCDQQGLARTSRTPGRTQQFVLFDLGEERRLMDLPGFGYAVVDKATRAHWQIAMPRYLKTRAALAGLVLIADSRHPLKQDELDFVRWTLAAQVPLVVLLNKADKLGRQALTMAMRAAAREVEARGGESAAVLPFSATTRAGVPELRTLLHGWFTAADSR